MLSDARLAWYGAHPVGITSKSTQTSKQRPAAVHHLMSRSPAQLKYSLRPALKRAAVVNTRQSRVGPRRCDRVHNVRAYVIGTGPPSSGPATEST